MERVSRVKAWREGDRGNHAVYHRQRELHQLALHRGRAALERDPVDHGEVVVEHGPEGREEQEGGVRHACLQPAQRPRADRVQGGHQLLLRHGAEEGRHEGLHLDAVQAVVRGEASARNKPNRHQWGQD